DRQAPSARVRYSGPEVPRSSAAQNSSVRKLPPPYGPVPEARSSGNAAPRTHPHISGSAPPIPRCSDDPLHAPWLASRDSWLSNITASHLRRNPVRVNLPETVSTAGMAASLAPRSIAPEPFRECADQSPPCLQWRPFKI